MVLGALGRLTGESVRELARNLFAGFYERGLSANEALNELREAGLGYRRGDFLADYRSDRPGYDLASSVSRLGEDFIPREGLLKEQFHGVPDKYSFVFKQSGVDPNTGEVRENYFFYHRNTLDTKGNMEEEAQAWADEEGERYALEDVTVKMVAGYINPVWA